MDFPFFNNDDDVTSEDLAAKLREKREELARIRERHAEVIGVVEEREMTLNELRARQEIGIDAEGAIAEVEEELEAAREKRSEHAERRDALERAIPILEKRLREARQEEVQAEYDERVDKIKGKIEKVTEHLSKAAELQAEARLLAHQGSHLASRYNADDYFGCGGPAGANQAWFIFDEADVVRDWISGDEPFSIVRNPRMSSQLGNWLDTLEGDSRIDDVEITTPDPVTEGSTKMKWDE